MYLRSVKSIYIQSVAISKKVKVTPQKLTAPLRNPKPQKQSQNAREPHYEFPPKNLS